MWCGFRRKNLCSHSTHPVAEVQFLVTKSTLISELKAHKTPAFLVFLDLNLSNLRAKSFTAPRRPQKSLPLNQTHTNSFLSQYFNRRNFPKLIRKCNSSMNGLGLAMTTSCFYLLMANPLSRATHGLVNRHGREVRWPTYMTSR